MPAAEAAPAIPNWPVRSPRITSIVPSTITPDVIAGLQRAAFNPPLQDLLAPRDIVHEQRQVPGPAGAPDLLVSIFTRADHAPGGLGVYYIRGGGMIMGDRLMGIELALEWVELLDAVAVSVEYRLAPDAPDPAPSRTATPAWSGPRRTPTSSASTGRGWSCREPAPAAVPGWQRRCSSTRCWTTATRPCRATSTAASACGTAPATTPAWDALLGERRHTDQVPIYAAPARATDLTGLPPTLVDVGSAEVFRDEAVAYASRIWACGGVCELHV